MNPVKMKLSAIISTAASAEAKPVKACLKQALELFLVTRRRMGIFYSRLLTHILENEPSYFSIPVGWPRATIEKLVSKS